MPLSPEQGATVSRVIEGIVAGAEDEINRVFGRAVRRGARNPEWATLKAAELVRLQQALASVASATSQQVREATTGAVSTAYGTGVNAALADLEPSRLVPVLPPARAAAVALIARDMAGRIDGALGSVLRQVPDTYQRVVAESVAQMAMGTITRRTATQRAVNKFAADGVGSFVDVSGRRWNLGSYAEMASRTGMARAAVDGHLATLQASGNDLVYIIPGPRACPVCDQWAGQVLSIGGASSGHRSMSQARAAGWGHPNCRCATGIYLEGITNPAPVRPPDSGYRAGQDQRGMERQIRRYKTRALVAVTPEARASAEAKVREWQARLRGHLSTHPDLKRLRYRESPVRPTK